MKLNFNIDRESLKFKIWIYFSLFAVVLMAILWFLQILFLDTYYEKMKIAEALKTANAIISHYGEDDLAEYISSISYANDMYIHIETGDGTIIFSPTINLDRPPQPNNSFFVKKAAVKNALVNGTQKAASVIINERDRNNTLIYGTYLDDTEGQEVILYIFSPLFPVESTLDILIDQLKYVTLISLILAFVLSFLISNRISKPIVSITNSASELAKGNYDATFEGGQYSEIIQLADTLNFASSELAKSDNLHKDLIANVSHDLRTPLTMVKSYAEMIRDLSGDNPKKRNDHLQVIINESDRLNLLVADLLTLSKMQSGVEWLHIKEFCLRDSINSILYSYRFFSDQEGYRFTIYCDPAIAVTGDETRIKQVLSNLVNNAVKYSGEDKEITITVTEKDGVVRCSVTDRGPGIPEHELEHIWERYYKSSYVHSRNTEGTGLGLSIVKEILLLHGSAYGVEGRVNEGSTFWFELNSVSG
ncbi:MAG: ATP-binding protein [Eubacteriales bacterium]|nr:ATP-binding protein [Eubacteriales bacterium]